MLDRAKRDGVGEWYIWKLIEMYIVSCWDIVIVVICFDFGYRYSYATMSRKVQTSRQGFERLVRFKLQWELWLPLSKLPLGFWYFNLGQSSLIFWWTSFIGVGLVSPCNNCCLVQRMILLYFWGPHKTQSKHDPVVPSKPGSCHR